MAGLVQSNARIASIPCKFLARSKNKNNQGIEGWILVGVDIVVFLGLLREDLCFALGWLILLIGGALMLFIGGLTTVTALDHAG